MLQAYLTDPRGAAVGKFVRNYLHKIKVGSSNKAVSWALLWYDCGCKNEGLKDTALVSIKKNRKEAVYSGIKVLTCRLFLFCLI